MITLKEIHLYCDTLLSSKTIPDYCNNGLQVEGRPQIKRLATAVSASLATIEAAVEHKADALLVHHGLFWTGDSYNITGTVRKKLLLLLKNDISLLAYHLPLDMNQEFGNNWKAAQDLGWTELRPFGFNKGLYLGVQGKFPKISREKFQHQLENYYQHPAHCAIGGKSEIESAALISGGAYKYITEASLEGLDCFITGNFDEPVWHQAYEERINFFSLGHSATEKIGPKALGKHLQEKFNLEYQFLDIPNPF
jgi:dinuclear metal center YbgI/SA1388 family protein